MQEVRAILRNARMSAQKARLVADLVRGQTVERAMETLEFSPKKAATLIKKVLESAMANAEHNEGLDIDELTISRIFVDEAAKLKRFSPRAKGRANRIVKHGCHITVVVANKVAEKTAKKTAAKKAIAKKANKANQSNKPNKTNKTKERA